MPRPIRYATLGAYLFSVNTLLACGTEGAPVEWVRVTRGDLIQEVEVVGEMRATDSVAVAPPPIGSVWEYKLVYLIEEGEQVVPGTRLLEFDTDSLKRLLEVAETEASRVSEELKQRVAESRLTTEDDRLGVAQAEATAQLNRLKSERPAELTSGLELQAAALDRELADQELSFRHTRSAAKGLRDRADIAILSNKLERTRASVAALKQNIEDMIVKSPRAGVVIHRASRDGEKKKPGDSVWRGESVLDVVTLSNVYALGSADEVYSSQLAVGQLVTLRLDAYPDKSYEGKLRKLHQTIRREGEGTVMDVDLELTSKTPPSVRPGMRFRAKIETSRVKNVLNAPIEAVFVQPQGPLVYRKQGAKAEPLGVRLGQRTDRFVEILAGISAGDQILKNPGGEPEP